MPKQILLYPGVGILLATSQLLSGNPAFAVVLLIAFGVISLLQTRWGIDLTPQALVMRGITRREIPWSEISGIESDSLLGTTMVRPHLVDGSRPRARAPLTGFLQRDPEFEAKLARIEEYWREHGGNANGSPAPPPA